jgi:acyl carrier protein phosphodiesterase
MVDDRVPGAPQPGADLAALKREVEQLRRQFLHYEPEPQSPDTSPTPTAFMVMPFGSEDLQVVYEDFIKPVVESKFNLDCVRGDDMFGSNAIMDDVFTAIRDAKIVIADLTGRNANVFYEVGIAHAISKPVLLVSQSLDDIPFDLRHRRVQIYEYSPRGCKRLESLVEQHLEQMLADCDAAT